MTRLPCRKAAGIAFGLLLTANAQASDIVCNASLRPSVTHCDDPLAASASCHHSASHAANLICDYAMLQREYERIHADQRRQLRAGAIDEDDIAAWRKRRDACTSVPCLDRVFASWRRHPGKKPPSLAAAPQPSPPEAPAQDMSRNRQSALTIRGEASRLPAARPTVARPTAAQSPAARPAAPQPAVAQSAAAQPPAAQPPAPPSSPPLAEPGIRQHPVVIERIASAPPPQQTSMHPMREPQRRGWGSLGTLAWLSMCSAGVACWSRRMRGEWLPGITRLRERAHKVLPIAWLVGGLFALNGVLLIFALTNGWHIP